jgi:translocation and assembly module TamA
LGRLVYAVAATVALGVQAVAAPASAAQPRAVLEGALDPELRSEIIAAIGETDRPIQNRFEARRRATAAAEAAIAVLRSEGYYAYVVEPDVGEGDTPRPVVRITPGPRFVIASPAIAWAGTAPDLAAAQAAGSALGPLAGRPGRAAEVVSAEGRAVAAVQKHGYADASAQPREVVVDHADHTVRPTYHLATGQLVRLDGLELVTKGRTDAHWLQGLAPWKAGQPYDPEAVAELERRLLDAGVYDSVTVALAPADKATPDGLRPVVVSLAERKRRTIELGASYGTTEGLGLDARWTRYNLLGRADTLALLGRLSNIDSRVGVTLTLPHWRKPAQTLTSNAAVYKIHTDAYDETGVGVRSDLQRRFGKTSYLTFGASADFSRTEAIRIGSLTPLGRDIFAVGTLADLALDRSDDPLDPRRGWRVSARAEPTVLFGQGVLPYVKVQAQGSYYLPIGAQARTVLAARVHLGSILNATTPDIPASRRFYAGGGGSVRGFSYQAVGPRLADNTPQGGVSLLETSVEIRHELTRKWGVVAFVDTGSVGVDKFPGPGNLSVGAGVGVRYNLGFGPIRVDVATPLNPRQGDPPVQIYVSIGQSF